MKYNKLPILLEYTWLVLAVVCFGLAIQNKFFSTGEQFTTLIILVIVSFLLYLIRRNRRMHNNKDS